MHFHEHGAIEFPGIRVRELNPQETSSPKLFRPWQHELWSQFLELDWTTPFLFLVRAATGSGKSLTGWALCDHHLKQNRAKVALYVGPTCSTSRDELISIQLPSDKLSTISIFNLNLARGQKVKVLASVLESARSSKPGFHKFVATTWATATACFRQFPHLFDKDTLLWVDESHGVDLTEDEENRLGDLVKDAHEKGCSVIYTSATPYERSSGWSFMKAYPNFVEFDYPVSRHIVENTQIKNVHFGLAVANGIDELGQVIEGLRGTKWDPTTKRTLALVGRPTWKTKVRDFLLDTADELNIPAYDLVTELGRSKTFKNIADKKGLAWITALYVARVGWDDPELQMVLHIGAPGSVVLMLQVPGRLIRDFPDKEDIYVLYVVVGDPHSELKEQFQTFTTATVSLMMMKDIMRDPNPKSHYSRVVKPETIASAIKHALALNARGEDPETAMRNAMAQVGESEWTDKILAGMKEHHRHTKASIKLPSGIDQDKIDKLNRVREENFLAPFMAFDGVLSRDSLSPVRITVKGKVIPFDLASSHLRPLKIRSYSHYEKIYGSSTLNLKGVPLVLRTPYEQQYATMGPRKFYDHLFGPQFRYPAEYLAVGSKHGQVRITEISTHIRSSGKPIRSYVCECLVCGRTFEAVKSTLMNRTDGCRKCQTHRFKTANPVGTKIGNLQVVGYSDGGTPGVKRDDNDNDKRSRKLLQVKCLLCGKQSSRRLSHFITRNCDGSKGCGCSGKMRMRNLVPPGPPHKTATWPRPKHVSSQRGRPSLATKFAQFNPDI